MKHVKEGLISSAALAIFTVFSSFACLAEGVESMGDARNSCFQYLNKIAKEVQRKLSCNGTHQRGAVLRLHVFPESKKFEILQSSGDSASDSKIAAAVKDAVEQNSYSQEQTCVGLITVFLSSHKDVAVYFSPAPEYDLANTVFYDLSGKPDLGPYKADAQRRICKVLPAVWAHDKGVLTFDILANGSVTDAKIECSSKDRKLDQQVLDVASQQLAFRALPVPGPQKIAVTIIFGQGSITQFISLTFKPMYR